MAASETSRRSFLKTGVWSGAALLGLGELPWLRRLGAVSAEDVQVPTDMIRFRPEIEPLVRLLEETPRERALEEVAHQIRQGLGYRELLTALMLAGVRNIRPGPVVGSKLHAVLVLNSAHLASQASPPGDRWLPLLWAVDEFKYSQNRDVEEGDWTMPAPTEASLPSPGKAPAAFADAMKNWDEEAADRAMTAWVRSASPWEIYDKLWFQGARDYLHIGHKAIYVVNSYRTLKVIGEQHAEGVLRPLARGLVVHGGNQPPAEDTRELLPWSQNKKHLAALKAGWQKGALWDGAATRELLAVLRQASTDEASAHVVKVLNKGLAVAAVWEALFLFAAELVMRKPNIFSLHAQTHTNAMHFAYQSTRDDATRRFLLLQNVAFMPYFRVDTWERATGFTRPEMGVAGDLSSQRIDSLQADGRRDGPAPSIEQIFAELGRDRRRATLDLLTSLEKGTDVASFLGAARMLVFLKGSDPHDYKFSSAIMEDHAHLTPAWRGRFLAANLSLLRSSTASKDYAVSERARRLLAV